MSEQQFLWNSLDGGENVFIKGGGSDKSIHIKIIEGKYEFVDFMKKVNEQQSRIQRWKSLYELKDSEVTARVDTLNRVCNYYLTETRFKGDTDPNEAVKEVINEILNAPIWSDNHIQ